MRTARRLLKALVRIAVLFYLLAGGALYFFQEKLLFHGDALPADFHFGVRLPFEERVVDNGGERVSGILIRAPRSRGLLLHFHGNAGDLSDWSEVGETLAQRLGLDVWMVDYPGLGKSTGSIRSEAQLHGLADAVFAAARKEAGARPLVLMGRSIGTGLAVPLAAKNDVAALVLETPFYSLRRLARLYYPWAPLFLLRYPFDSFEAMPKVRAPSLVLHGDADELIPYGEGRALAGLGASARLVTIPGGHHNDLGGSSLYWRELTAFLDSALPPAKEKNSRSR